ncbi:hypothetical protein [Ferribacterium limneticum]|uniref:hypothetical protein n=1 Tax=Ferribacterium limneticum TaxID=76259 RepID=UPI001CF8DF10|nr:hypothetical protein [Ferribacterium limneticum]UCV23599.1 hypothetical protein KI613_03400 [Ferribacterium limneticum]
MKLFTSVNAELMEVTSIRSEDGTLVISGTIMGAMPVEAVLRGAEMRKAVSMMGIGTILSAIRIFLFK